MIPDYYVQTEYNDSETERKTVKRILIYSYVLKTCSLVFAVLAVTNAWYLSGFAFLFGVGVLLRQLTLERIGRFEYFLVNGKLKFGKISNFDAKKQVVEIELKDVSVFEQKMPENAKSVEIFAPTDRLLYVISDGKKQVYFAPSKYFAALIAFKTRQIKNENTENTEKLVNDDLF